MSENTAWSAALSAGVSPAALRNAPPIAAVLAQVLAGNTPPNGLVLEIAAGAGYHACVFAKAMPDYRWQPTEADARGCEEIAARRAVASLPNLLVPCVLDVTAEPWPVAAADAVVCINMIHISPWQATVALFAGAARRLPVSGLLVTYGPYRIAGDYQAESNRAFDESLRARNPAWGIRDVNELDDAAADNGFDRTLLQPMPANNHVLVFRKRG